MARQPSISARLHNLPYTAENAYNKIIKKVLQPYVNPLDVGLLGLVFRAIVSTV